MQGLIPEAYAPFASIFRGAHAAYAVTTEADVAEAVWRAAHERPDSCDFRPAPMPSPWRGRKGIVI